MAAGPRKPPPSAGTRADGHAAPGRQRSTGAIIGPGLLTLAGILLAAANLRAAITPVGPVLEDLRRELDVDAVTSSVLTSVPVIAFAVCSPRAPAVARRVGIARTIAGTLLVPAVAGRSLPLPSASGPPCGKPPARSPPCCCPPRASRTSPGPTRARPGGGPSGDTTGRTSSGRRFDVRPRDDAGRARRDPPGPRLLPGRDVAHIPVHAGSAVRPDGPRRPRRLHSRPSAPTGLPPCRTRRATGCSG